MEGQPYRKRLRSQQTSFAARRHQRARGCSGHARVAFVFHLDLTACSSDACVSARVQDPVLFSLSTAVWWTRAGACWLPSWPPGLTLTSERSEMREESAAASAATPPFCGGVGVEGVYWQSAHHRGLTAYL